MTDSATARRYVLISIFGLLVLEAYRGKLQTAEIGLSKRLWGVGVLAIMLSLLADVAPAVAGPFAVLVLVGAFTKKGDNAFAAGVNRVAGKHQLQTDNSIKARQGQ